VATPSDLTDAPDPGGVNLDDPQRCPICQAGRLMLIEFLTPERIWIQDSS
jgi:hypothetical protein